MNEPSAADDAKPNANWLRKNARETPLVPPATIAGHALVSVIAIMTFLACLAAGAAILIGQASQDWSANVASEATIQLRASAGRDSDADAARIARLAEAAPGISNVRVLTKQESSRLLEPWLGQGLDLDELPVPRMIVLRLTRGTPVDFNALRRDVIAQSPGAIVDDHHAWSARLATMGRTIVFIALFVAALLIAALALAVAFATRGTMAGNRDIIEVLHLVGGADSYISRQFQRHFLGLGLRGGIIGAGCAALFFVIAGTMLARLSATPSGDQIEALFGSFSLGLAGYIAIAFVAAITAALTGVTSRIIVFRHLRRLA